MNAELRFDLEDNARKMNQLINAKSSLVQNEEKSLISNMSLARHLPRDVREKIIGLTHKDKDKNKEILKTLVGEYKFSRLMSVELRYYDFMQKFIEVLKLAETPIRLAGCECILDNFRKISELDDAGIYQEFTQASQACIDSEANPEMKKLEKYLCETLVISLKEQTDYYPDYSPISLKDFKQLIDATWWMFNDTIFVVLNALSKINHDKLAHERFIKNLNLRELIPEHQGGHQGGRKSRKRHYRNKRRVNTRKYSRHGKHQRRK
jgi:hypothetical protein